MTADTPLYIHGAPGSPYTRKLVALLRYRRIAHQTCWSNNREPRAGFPASKVALMPTVYRHAAKGPETLIDTSPIIRQFENDYAGRATVPKHPILHFLNDLIEDYGDEWLTKAMFHYRWYHPRDRANVEPLLVFWNQPSLDDAEAENMARLFGERQFNRLYVVGSNDVTAQTIESSYERLIAILDKLLAVRGFVLGGRPCSADFALYGQFTQLIGVEPTSTELARKISARVMAWVGRMEDLSGLEVSDDDWFDEAACADNITPLLTEIGRTYIPFLNANAAAAANGQESFETEIDGRAWTQPTFPYQAKCKQWLVETYQSLSDNERGPVNNLMTTSGCAALFEDAT